MINYNYKLNNDLLTIFVNDRIDSLNANSVEESLFKIINENQFKDLILDLEELNYISSAGLRIILKVKKAFSTLKIINVNNDVYEIFDMTGFSEMIDIEKQYRKLELNNAKEIGRGAKGIVYRYSDEIIVKVYKNPDSIDEIKREHELARRAFVLGVPTAISYDIVKVGDKYGSAFELLDAINITINKRKP